MKEKKICQSCGFQLKKEKTPPEIDTAGKMQKFCLQEMNKDGINSFFAWLTTRLIAKLERWKQ